jgi:exodeoxyribonuclease VII large subunit
VARAIHASTIPVVSAVGHETDFSISDFAADLRAPTPSAAAELVSPGADALQSTFAAFEGRLLRFARQRLQSLYQALDHLAHRLAQQHPGQRLAQHRKLLLQARQRLYAAGSRIVPERRRALAEMQHRLLPMARRLVPERRQKLGELARTLNALSPLPTLARGYAIVTDEATGAAITTVKTITTGDKLRTQLGDGQVISTVDDTNDASPGE